MKNPTQLQSLDTAGGWGQVLQSDKKQKDQKTSQRYLKFASPCHPELVSGSHQIGKNEMLNQVQHDKSWGQMLETNSQTFYVRIYRAILGSLDHELVLLVSLRSSFAPEYGFQASSSRCSPGLGPWSGGRREKKAGNLLALKRLFKVKGRTDR
jgi:hypothetical protein